jgi:hypothetical protein
VPALPLVPVEMKHLLAERSDRPVCFEKSGKVRGFADDGPTLYVDPSIACQVSDRGDALRSETNRPLRFRVHHPHFP